MKLIVCLTVPDYPDAKDVADSVVARLADEAGYLDSGDPVTPFAVTAFAMTDGGKPLAMAEAEIDTDKVLAFLEESGTLT